MDVDGVLSVFGFGHTPPSHTVGALVDGMPHVLSREAARVLGALSRTFQCVWCTGWEERAAEHLPHLLGLPAGWPVIELGSHARGPGVSTAGHWKLGAIDAFAGPTRALAWIDDALDEACHAWAAARPGPTLLVTTDPSVGLTAVQGDELLAWAAEVGAGERRL